ncbi:unnamed protein product [Brachionus calyciflorus]|uniref:HTH CENPB-type domain-containing protein n=1 Tax=Brachionus calyciflorus TaxID=104777 RepID=A0A814QVB3_9BILA|nr:unnamed protein product [Brachionus calyciflorus]
MNSVLSRKKRITLLNSTKKAIVLEKLKTNKSDDVIAAEFNVDRSTVTKIIKNKETYLNYDENEPANKKSRIQNGSFHLIEKALFKWYVSAKSANIPLSYEILHEKALQFYAEFKSKNVPMKDKFEASRGWISNFLHRHNLSSKIMSGESESVDLNSIQDFKKKITSLVEKYEPCDVYNCDKAGLFYGIGPNRTIAAKDEQCKGFKKDKSRVTVLFTVNATGTAKIKPCIF